MMDDRSAARQIAAIFGRSCREPGNDPGLDPALDSAAEVVASIRADARAEALKLAEKQSREWYCAVSNDYDHEPHKWAFDLAQEQKAIRAAILADEPKEREADRPQVGDEDFHRQMLLAFQEIRRKRRDEGMSEWADGDMAAWVMDRLPALRSHQAEEIKLRAEVERKLKEAER